MSLLLLFNGFEIDTSSGFKCWTVVSPSGLAWNNVTLGALSWSNVATSTLSWSTVIEGSCPAV